MKVNKIIIFKYDECDTFRILTLFAFYSVIAFYSGRYFQIHVSDHVILQNLQILLIAPGFSSLTHMK